MRIEGITKGLVLYQFVRLLVIAALVWFLGNILIEKVLVPVVANKCVVCAGIAKEKVQNNHVNMGASDYIF